MQVNDFQTHQRNEVTGQIASLKSGQACEYNKSSEIRLTGSRSCWSHKLVGTLIWEF